MLVLGSMALSGSAAALTIAKVDPDTVFGAREEPRACARASCLQPVQMPPWFGDRQRAMPADQRELLARLLSPELSEVVSQAERQILSQALERGDRLSADAVSELGAMLREKQSQQAQRLATAKAEAEREAKEAQARADAEREARETQARANAEREARETQARADAERETRETQARANAEREARETQARADAEREAREAQARADAERESAEAAQALAEAKQEAEAAAANAARLVFYDEFPPLQPL